MATTKEIWIVMDENGYPIYCAGYSQACHEHINDAINDHDIEGAPHWKVQQAVLVPNVELSRKQQRLATKD